MPINNKSKPIFSTMLFIIFLRNFQITNTFIDVRENDFMEYLAPVRKNYFLFDYYQYYVCLKTKKVMSGYHYWNISFGKIDFITDKDNIKDKKFKIMDKQIIQGPFH